MRPRWVKRSKKKLAQAGQGSRRQNLGECPNAIQGEALGKSSVTISVKPVGVGAVSQRLIPLGERSSLQTHIATTESVSLCERMKS